MEQEKKDYGKTLNLPQTEFAMRGNLPKKEPQILKYWEELDIYELVAKTNEGKPKFILHDGPPYANGDIHLGHALNKVLKDIIVKQKSQVGYDAPYVPGWDTHGLPIELKAIKKLGLDHHNVDKVEFRKHCAEYARSFVQIQMEEFKRLGVRGDWAHPYLTLQPEFEAEEIGVFGEMAKKGYIYKGVKPVHWCSDCETALAEAEIEYAEKRSPSIYVKFPVVDSKGLFAVDDKTFVVIWTTTPWTLPANMAVSVHPEFVYQLLQFGNEKYVMAKEMVDKVIKDAELPADYQVLATFNGKDMEYMLCRHPFMERDSLVILGEHVTLEQGSGCVHTAPGHGNDDFVVGKKYGLEILSPVNDQGVLTEEAGMFAGMKIDDANKPIVQWLDEHGYLLKLKFIKHQYPHCWRCKQPTMFRATEQWFASIDGFRQDALNAIDQVQFIPSWGHDRIYGMIAERGDWCISRQRTWGVPIPIFYCQDCGMEIVNDETIHKIQDMVRQYGTDVWFAKDVEELIPENLTCPKCGSTHFRKETDIMDVWFDSGSSHRGVLGLRPNLQYPADLYLEGSDQHRGWFNSSLCTAIATNGTSPYKAVLTHGFFVDEQGRKMSKSLGNGIDPQEIIDDMGADILRLWVASADYRNDVTVSKGILKQVSEAYRKIRNTFRYMLGSLYDFDHQKDSVPLEEMEELDRWAMLKLGQLVNKVTQAYEEYEFHVVYHAVHNFCTVDMSAFYLDIVKDRLYSTKADSPARRSCQSAIFEICTALVKMLSPILSFTAEEVWHYLPIADKTISVQLAGWPEVDAKVFDNTLEAKWDKLIAIRNEVAKPLEEARRSKAIGHSLDAWVKLYADGEVLDFLKQVQDMLPNIFIVSKVTIEDEVNAPGTAFASDSVDTLKVQVAAAPGQKCERCWIYSEEIGSDPKHPDLCPRCAAVMNEIEK